MGKLQWTEVTSRELTAHGDRLWGANRGGRSYAVASTAGFGITASVADATRKAVYQPNAKFIGDRYPTVKAAQAACEAHRKSSTQ